ncbi:kinase-like domain-containing protein [Hypoxylon rubiginosum]|uniref:Kinase-like domain-containing protein n=1 Tax=Hypoxylon rubiginosum TaxID=110542 RepID=A0ACB9YKM3_9PEZI|nr:kinase-like domain-containing protein [Hypoxylon rubiginosum]
MDTTSVDIPAPKHGGDITSRLASISLGKNKSGAARSSRLDESCLIPDSELARAVKDGGRLGVSSHAYLMPDGRTVVKQGTSRLLSEAYTMRIVREYTDVPVPEVYEVLYDDGPTDDAQMLMEYVEGRPLEHAWPAYSAREKTDVVAQLRRHFATLASQEGPFVGAVDGTPVRDDFFECVPANRVYAGEKDFNRGLLRAWYQNTKEVADRDPRFHALWSMFDTTAMLRHRLVMTYNNLHPRNILVRGSKVVALLDWSQAGYLPEYWEYCRVWGRLWETCGAEKSFLTGKECVLDQILAPYEEEMTVFQFRFSQLETKFYYNPEVPRRKYDPEKGIYVW